MSTPNDELAAKVGTDKMTSNEAYAQKHGQYEDKTPVDIDKVPALPVTSPAPFGALK